LNQGLFITLEGGEGAGKSTQKTNMVNWFLARDKDVVETREPGGTAISEQIRQVLLDTRNAGLEARTEALLMFAAREQLLQEVIRPALLAGKVVICDRFTDASYAYQGGGRQLGESAIATLERFVHEDLKPDITFLFDVSIDQGMSRVAGRGESDRIEQESKAFFERVQQAYRQRALADPERFRIIDASLPPEQVWLQVKTVLEGLLT
jgi:dTMP kinase